MRSSQPGGVPYRSIAVIVLADMLVSRSETFGALSHGEKVWALISAVVVIEMVRVVLEDVVGIAKILSTTSAPVRRVWFWIYQVKTRIHRLAPAHPPQEDVVRHEAAHAVASSALGIGFDGIDMTGSGRTAAMVFGDEPAGLNTDPNVTFDVLVSTVAGHVHDVDCSRANAGSSSDLTLGLEFAAGILSMNRRPDGFDGPMTTDGLMAAAYDRARAILAEHAVIHELLVDTLTERRIYFAEELDPILSRISPAPLRASA